MVKSAFNKLLALQRKHKNEIQTQQFFNAKLIKLTTSKSGRKLLISKNFNFKNNQPHKHKMIFLILNN